MSGLADEVRAAAAGEWRRMQAHPFVVAIEEDRLPPAVLRRYLVNEYAFVETAIAIFGYALAKAPGIDERRALARIVTGLAEEQVPYFTAAFARLGMEPEDWRDAALPPRAAMLRDGMLGYAAHGGFPDIVAAMLAAEWTYATFCTRAAARPISDPVLRDWIELHAAEPFLAQAEWLRATLDRLGATADAAARRRLASVFATALALEIEFHHAPFDAPGPQAPA